MANFWFLMQTHFFKKRIFNHISAYFIHVLPDFPAFSVHSMRLSSLFYYNKNYDLQGHFPPLVDILCANFLHGCKLLYRIGHSMADIAAGTFPVSQSSPAGYPAGGVL